MDSSGFLARIIAIEQCVWVETQAGQVMLKPREQDGKGEMERQGLIYPILHSKDTFNALHFAR